MDTKRQAVQQAGSRFSRVLAVVALTVCAGALVCPDLLAAGGETMRALGFGSDGPTSETVLMAGRSPSERAYVPDEILFKVKVRGENRSDRAWEALARVAARHALRNPAGLFPENKRGLLRNTYRAYLPPGVSPPDAARRMKADPDIEWAEPNYYMTFFRDPIDPYYSSQWHLPKISAPAAWDTTVGSPGVVVAVVDTGIDLDHPDLSPNIWTNNEGPGDANGDGYPGIRGYDDDGDDKTDEDSQGREPDDPGYNNDLWQDDDENGFIDDIHGYDFVSVASTVVGTGEDPGPRDNDVTDVQGHGTYCAGLVGAVGNNNIDVTGVNWTVTVMTVRAGYKGKDGRGYLNDADAAAAIGYAVANGADVISMSFGGTYSDAIADAVAQAYQAGVMLVAAAGNSAVDHKFYPAALPHVLAVSATNSSDAAASFTCYGSWVDVAAPGVSITSTGIDGRMTANGTSAACPIVAGIAGLCLAHTPTLTNDQVCQILKSTTDDLHTPIYLGVGRVNAADAVLKTTVGTAELDPALDEVLYPRDPLPINGTSSGSYTLSYGAGAYPTSWTEIASGGPVTNGYLGTLNVPQLTGAGYYSIRLVVDAGLPTQAEDRKAVWVDQTLLDGWPQSVDPGGDSSPICASTIVADVDNDSVNELFAVSYNGRACLWKPDGSVVTGWPKTLAGNATVSGSPAVADIDGGGDLEIVVPTTLSISRTCQVHVFKHNGVSVPGWPKTSGYMYTTVSGAVIGDIDGDADPEIMCGWYSYNWEYPGPYAVMAWHHNGTSVSGWPVAVAGGQTHSPLALADIDGDGVLDVVIPYRVPGGGVAVTVANGGGQILPGWPSDVLPGSDTPNGCTVGDLQGDGLYEIVLTSNGGTMLYGLDYQGNPVAGWAAPGACSVGAGTALGDVDDDGRLEIAYQDVCCHLSLCDWNGRTRTGWPQHTGNMTYIGIIPFYSSPCFADVTGDGRSEVITGSEGDSAVYAFSQSGSVIPNFPKRVGAAWDGTRAVWATPEIADLNGDGTTELIVGALDGKVYIWDTGAPISAGNEWTRLSNQPQRHSRHDRAVPYPAMRVKPTGNDANDGSTWQTAKRTIQAAVDASPTGGEIWVAQGTYNEHVTISKRVNLYGGFRGTEGGLPQRNWTLRETVIDSQDTGTAITVTGVTSPGVRIDGFTIRSTPLGFGGGIVSQYSPITVQHNKIIHNTRGFGGGLYVGGSTCTVLDNTFEGNTSDYGGAVCLESSSGTISNNAFNGNVSQSHAGAIYMSDSNAAIQGNTFHQNSAAIGGAVVVANDAGSSITGDTFTDNAAGSGAGIYFTGTSTVSVVGCTFQGNDADSRGGALCIHSGTPVISRCTITGNTSGQYGGGICFGSGSAAVRNCIIRGNSAAHGGGIAGIDGSAASVTNNTIIENTGSSSGGGVFCEQAPLNIKNNVIAFNAHGVTATDSTPSLTFNNVYGNAAYDYSPGLTPGTGSISADPAFADRAGGDLHLTGMSLCIDGGTNSGAPNTDFDNNPRPRDGDGDGIAVCDIGAYEFRRLFVKWNSPGPIDGSTWTRAYHTIQEGINAALPGDEIWVATGNYTEYLVLKNGVVLYGGFAGNESHLADRDWTAHVTTIDGSGGTALTLNSITDFRTRVDGFAITGCDVNARAVYCNDAAVGVIANNTITNNDGGGLTCTNGSDLTFINNVFAGNSAVSGGGVAIEDSYPLFRDNLFSGNSAEEYGGAIYCISGFPVFVDNIITGNSAAYGAGVSTAFMAYSVVLTNNTIWGNAASNRGGGIYLDSSWATTVHNNIIANNQGYGISYYAEGECGEYPGTADLRNNNWHGNIPGDYDHMEVGLDDVYQDPLLAGAAQGDFHLTEYSPCRDTGYDASPELPSVDMDDQARVAGSTVDIGADEYLLLMVKKTGNDANSGVTWPLAKLTVQAAIDSTANGPAEVWVAAGTYCERCTVRNKVAVFGGFAGTEEHRSDRNIASQATILDGEYGGESVVRFAAGVGSDTRLDGFTVQRGSSDYGGGINCEDASPVIANNTVTDNQAFFGGGIYSDAQSQPVIVNNVIYGNDAVYDSQTQSGGWGGGINIQGGGQILNNTVDANTSNNAIGGIGGGIYCTDSPAITNNVVTWNTDGISGGTPALFYNNVFGNFVYNYSAGLSPGVGSISKNPFFVKRNQGDYHVKGKSPCIDAGTNTGAPTGDLDGRPRPIDGDGNGTTICDMGAYERPTDLAGALKQCPNGSHVELASVSVTACLTGFDTTGINWVYVENTDRSAGIRVRTDRTFSIDQLVTVAGTVQTDTGTGERYVQSDSTSPVQTGGTFTIAAVGIGNRWLGGRATGYEPVIRDGIGLYNVGLLVQSWGRVTYSSSVGRFFYINDGSHTWDGSGYMGVRIVVPVGVTVPAVNTFVKVKGISGASLINGFYVRTLRVRMQSDIGSIFSWCSDPVPLATSTWNALSLPGIPAYSAPESVFVGSQNGAGIQLEGFLKYYDDLNQQWFIHGDGCAFIPSCELSRGYMLYIPPGGATSYYYDRTSAEGDQVISLPAGSATPVNFSLVGNPFDAAVPWDGCMVTDGSWTGTLSEAVECGFIHEVRYWDGSSWCDVTDLSTGSMSPRTAYQVYPVYSDLAVVVPAQ